MGSIRGFANLTTEMLVLLSHHVKAALFVPVLQGAAPGDAIDEADGDGGATSEDADEDARSGCTAAAATLTGLAADADRSICGIGGALGCSLACRYRHSRCGEGSKHAACGLRGTVRIPRVGPRLESIFASKGGEKLLNAHHANSNSAWGHQTNRAESG